MNAFGRDLGVVWQGMDRRSFLLALALLVISTIGLVHVFFGQWRPSPGGNPWLVPLICYLVIAPTSLMMAVSAVRGTQAADESAGGALPVIATAAWSMAFFHVVINLGLVVGTFASMVLAMILLSPRPRAAWKLVLPLGAVLGVVFWLMFTRLAPILMRDPWLF